MVKLYKSCLFARIYLSFAILLVMLFSGHAFAQGKQGNNWHFGFWAGLSFNAGSPPEVLYDGQTSLYNGVASISDNEGNLLFYADGYHIWNREHRYNIKWIKCGY